MKPVALGRVGHRGTGSVNFVTETRNTTSLIGKLSAPAPALIIGTALWVIATIVVAVSGGKLDFGPWEQIFYGEFDGRRRKRVLVKIIGE